MAGCGCNAPCETNKTISPRFRKALWIALFVNASMFVVEVIAGATSGSVSLWADSLDFAGDAANYAISLAVLGMSLSWRSTAALFKGLTMAAFGLFVLGKAGWSYFQGIPPEAITMGIIGFIALLANAGVAVLLYTFRDGDANMRSVWLCSRNDAIGNIAVMLAALGVMGTASVIPDLIVAVIIAGLGLSSGISVIKQARQELKSRYSEA